MSLSRIVFFKITLKLLFTLLKVPNSAIMACNNYTDLEGKDFMDIKNDHTIRAKLAKTGYH